MSSLYNKSVYSTYAGNKLNNVDVVYTQWSNLKKTGEMDIGQIGFFNQKEVFVAMYSCEIIFHEWFLKSVFAISL